MPSKQVKQAADKIVLREYFKVLGAQGGKSKSSAKSDAARANGKLGGWPKGKKRKKKNS